MQGDLVKQIVSEVRRMELAATARSGSLLPRDIDTLPSKVGSSSVHSNSSIASDTSAADTTQNSCPRRAVGRLDLAASMAQTDAMLAALQRGSHRS